MLSIDKASEGASDTAADLPKRIWRKGASMDKEIIENKIDSTILKKYKARFVL